MEIVKLERNKEFDRPYLDVVSEEDRYLSTSKVQGKCVTEWLQQDTQSKASLKPVLPKTSEGDRVGPLFSFNRLRGLQSTNAASYRVDHRHREAILKASESFRIKRNELSDYTERRIKFGFKF